MRVSLICLVLLGLVCLIHGLPKKKAKKAKLDLKVGKEAKNPTYSDKQGKKISKKKPTTDVVPQIAPQNETVDLQTHSQNRTLEKGKPPKYPLKPFSSEVTAHQDEIGGCNDHSSGKHVCMRCADKCFAAEHEVFAYSYCRKSCGLCDSKASEFHTYWRLRAGSLFDPTWMLKKVEWYATANQNISLVDDSSRSYASSSFPGFNPRFAMEDNDNTSWYPSGWGIHDNNDDWIAYEFKVAVRIHAVRMALSGATYSPKKVFVEAADNKFGPFQTKWIIRNPNSVIDQVYSFQQCPVLWKKYETDEGAWCYRIISKLRTWQEANKTCQLEGGMLASLTSQDETDFIVNTIRPCGYTWIGLSQTNGSYMWSDNMDGSNNCPARSEYKNWKKGTTYSDVLKDLLNCVAIDEQGNWLSFHCSDKFYFVCKQELKPRPDPQPDLVAQNNPTEPEIPPLIFPYPNITVPVVNSLNLEPGVFPDINGNVEEEEEEEEETVDDLLFDQAVAHLKQQGIEPPEEMSNDVNIDEQDYTQQINELAIKASKNNSDAMKNETVADNAKSGSAKEQKLQQKIEHQQQYQEDNKAQQPASQPYGENPPTADQQGKSPTVEAPPISSPTGDTPMPNIVNGKPVEQPAPANNSNENLAQNAGSASMSVNKPPTDNTPNIPSSIPEQQTGNQQPPVATPGPQEEVQTTAGPQTTAGAQPTAAPQTTAGNPQESQSAPVFTAVHTTTQQENQNIQPTSTTPQPPQENVQNNQDSTVQGQIQGATVQQPSAPPSQPPAIQETQSQTNPTQAVQSPTAQSGEELKQPENNNQQQQQQSGQQESTSQGNQSNNKEDENSTEDTQSTQEAPQPTNTQPQNADGAWNNGPAQSIGGGSPSKLPTPPAPKEGKGDNDNVPSVGYPPDVQAEGEEGKMESTEEESKPAENKDDENKEKEEESPKTGSKGTKSTDDEKTNGEDSEQQSNDKAVMKPIEIKPGIDEESQGMKAQDETNGGVNKSKKKKGSTNNSLKKKHVPKTKGKLAKAVKEATAKHEKKTSIDHQGSGSGDEGDDDDLDDIFQTITDKMW